MGLVRSVLGVIFCVVAITGTAAERTVAITIDDLPWAEFATSSPALVAARHRSLVPALRGTGATGFVNEDKLYVAGALVDARRAMLEDWLDAGLELGNHTYGHVGLHGTDAATYTAAIARGEEVLRPLLAARGRTPRWFRHPYLQAGRADAVRAQLDAYLHDHDYRIAPVTIDNGDWVFARAYLAAIDAGDSAYAEALRIRFVDYIDAKFAFFEHETRALFGRDIAQVLLLHANAINADTMPDLLARLRRRGYRFVSLDTALSDPAYAHADGYRGGAGISWIHRWAMAESKPDAFYEGEPAVPPDVLARAGVTSE